MAGACSLGPRFVGDPVDVVTGEVRDIARDFKVAGPRPFHWDRTYHGFRSNDDRGLGRGHRHALDWVLRLDLDGLTLETPGDPIGFPHLWIDDTFVDRQGWRLRRWSATHFTAQRIGEPLREFVRPHPEAAEARLHRLVHADGGHTQLQYEGPRPQDPLIAVVDSQGWSLQLQWNGGRLRSVRGRVASGELVFVRYEYDELGRLVVGRDAYGHAFGWAYDDGHRVIRRTDRRGYSFVYSYDSAGRCVRAAGEDGVDAVALAYDADGLQTKVVHEANGATFVYRYGVDRNLLEIEDPYGAKRQFLYDADGQQFAETDGRGELWASVRDERGGLVGKRDPLGHLHSASEDVAAPELDPLRHRVRATTMEHEHGDLQRLGFVVPGSAVLGRRLPESIASALVPGESVGIERDVADPQGVLLRKEILFGDGRLHTTRYSYDPNGNLRRVRDDEGRERQYEHASWNHRMRERDPMGAEIRYAYSQRDRMVLVEDPGGTRTEYRWDLCDRLAEVWRNGTLRERYVRDASGHLLEKRDAEGKLLVGYERGPLGVLLRRWSPEGLDERFERDARGRLLRATVETPGHAPVECEFDHDVAGQRIRDVWDGAGVHHELAQGRWVATRFTARHRAPSRRYSPRCAVVGPTA